VRDVVADEVHAGLDGTILALDGGGCGNNGRKVICSGYRLGDPVTFPLQQGRRTIHVHEVGPRGTVWAESKVPANPKFDLRSWNGKRWVKRVDDGNYRRKGVRVANGADLAIGPDGSTWAVEDRDDGPRLVDIADDGHLTVPDVRPEFLRSSIDGRLILVDDGDRTLRIDVDGPDVFGDATYVPTEGSRFVGVSPAGVHWWLSDFTEANVPRSLVSYDGEDWESFEIPEGIPWWPLAVTQDGSVWLGAWTVDSLPGVTTGGVHRFDGSGWTTFFRDRIVGSLDQAANGMVWLAAFDETEVYVITPEAVAVTE
jgi:hypothetical protein